MIIEVLTAAVGEILGDIFGNALQRTLSKRELDRNLANAVERAHDRFIKEYSEHDHELVSILTQQTHFGDLPSVQAALQELLTRPFHDPSNSINVIELSFDDVLVHGCTPNVR